MTIDLSNTRFLIAGYGLPAEFGINTLFGMGVEPARIAVLTHATDARNAGLHAVARLRGLPLCESPAKSEAALQWAEDFSPDIMLSLHFRELIPERLLGLPGGGTVNLHPSVLPMYRGANSVAWAIINGEKETGFTFHRMEKTFDTGAILLQQTFPLRADETAFSLFHRQIVLAMARLAEVVTKLVQGDPGTAQAPGGSYHSRALPHEGKIDPAWPLDQIERFIRAMIFPPFPPAMLEADGQRHPVTSLDAYLRLADRLGVPVSA